MKPPNLGGFFFVYQAVTPFSPLTRVTKIAYLGGKALEAFRDKYKTLFYLFR